MVGSMPDALLQCCIVLAGVLFSDDFLEACVRNSKGLGNVQPLACQRVVQKKQQIQKLIIGVLGDAFQKRRDFLVTMGGKSRFY